MCSCEGCLANFSCQRNLVQHPQASKLFGTTDNYNTEATEWLHIDYAKDAYQATNHKDKFVQMTKWLKR